MADPKIEVLIAARDDASKKIEGVNKGIAGMSKQFKIAGAAMMAGGVAIAGGLMMVMKAAAEEEAGIVRLSVAMENMGISYDETRESLEAWIDTQQQKTAIADDAQRDSLANLILLTGDLAESQDLLSLSMDIAAGKGWELERATSMLLYALGGNWGMLERYIPSIKEAKTEEEKWMALREKFAGQAEAFGATMAGQMQLFQNNIGDLKEAIGTVLLPIMTPLLKSVQEFVQALKDIDPVMLRTIVLGAALSAGLLTIGGGLLLVIGFLPQIIGGFTVLTGWISAATASVWAFYASLLAFITIGAIAAAAITEITGQANYLRATGQSLWYEDIPRWIANQAGLTQAIGETTEAMGGAVAYLDTATSRVFYYAEDIEKLTEAEKENLIWIEKTSVSLGTQADAFELTGDALETYEKSIVDAKKTVDDLTKSIELVNKAAESQEKTFMDLIKQMEYQDSIAGELNITMDDIYNILHDLDTPISVLRADFERWGMEIGNVNDVIKILLARGIDVIEILGGEKTAVDSLSLSYAGLGDAIKTTVAMRETARGLEEHYEWGAGQPGAGFRSTEQFQELYLKYGYGEAFRMMAYKGVPGAIDKMIADIEKYGYTTMATMTSLQYGGIVPGRTGQPVPVIAHGGERFLGEGGITNIIHVYLDGREVEASVIEHITEELRGQGAL